MKDSPLFKLNSILEKKYKYYLLLFILTLFVGLIFQLVGIGSIIPLTTSFFGQSNETEIINLLINYFPFLSKFNSFFIILSFFVGCIILSNLIFIFATFLSAKITFAIERELRNTLYDHFINNDYKFFFNTTSSKFISLMINETQRLCQSVMLPLAEVLSRLMLVVGISLFLIFLISDDAIYIVTIIVIFYLIYYFLIRKRIIINNKLLTQSNEQLVKNSNDLFRSFREIKIYNLERFFLNKIIKITEKIQKIRFFTVFFSTSPRYYMEILMFLIIYIFFIYRGQNIDLGKMSILAVFIYSFFKILPSLQGLFAQFMVAKSNIDSLDVIYNKLRELKEDQKNLLSNYNNQVSKENKFESIEVKNLSFNFEDRNILENINLKIKKGDKIGIKGKSGSGKTTLINLLIGLLEPKKGELFFNNVEINSKDLIKKYNNKIGIVPQNPTMLETTVKENILLGKSEDINKLKDSIEIASLNEFIGPNFENLEKNIHSSSLNLSGGQIQRISIARAIYRNPNILIIDEGFNQLDHDNEKKVLKNILKIDNLTIIMIYHKMFDESLLDKIYNISDKKIV